MRKILFFFAIFFASISIVNAQNGVTVLDPEQVFDSSTQKQPLLPIIYFRSYQTISPENLTTPTIIEVPVTSSSERSYALHETISNTFQPFRIIQQTKDMPYRIYTIDVDTPEIYDKNPSTYKEYAVSETQLPEVNLNFTYAQPITTRTLSFALDENVQLPSHVTIQAVRGDKGVVVLARKEVTGTTISFPETRSDRFFVTFEYFQPLRITEIGFIQTPQSKQTSYVLRFLARPGEQHRLYQDPQGNVPSIQTGESPNLFSNADARQIFPSNKLPNEFFKAPDDDADGIENTKDNCPSTSNPDQADIDTNNRGDACEDFDVDGVMNNIDNCPDHPNRAQQDADGDGQGDHCDSEESRLVEQLSFLPWLGIGLGFVVVLLLFKMTVSKPSLPENHEMPEQKVP